MGWSSVRLLLKRPGITALAVTALGVGIGLTTTMFSIVNGVLLRGLPFDEADRIVVVGAFDKKRPEPPRPGNLAPADYMDVIAAQKSFDEIAAAYTFDSDTALLGPDGIPLRYPGARLTPNALRLLRVAPIKGRGFTEADAQAGAEKVVLLAETVWTTHPRVAPPPSIR